MIKTPFWGHFGPFLPKHRQMEIFPKHRAPSVFRFYNYLTICQKSEKTNNPTLKKRVINNMLTNVRTGPNS